MTAGVFFNTAHFIHPFQVQNAENQELSTTEKATAVASGVIPIILFPSLTAALVGVSAFYLVTAYFKAGKTAEVGAKHLDTAKGTFAEWLKKGVDTGSASMTVGDHRSCTKGWKEPSILTFGEYDRLDGYRADQFKRMERHGRNAKANYLSNYYPRAIVVDGRSYKSVEHYYQASKFTPGSSAFNQVVGASDANEARTIAQSNPGNVGDDQEMARRMKRALWAKFTDGNGKPNDLGRDLLNTGSQLLIEGNDRGARSDKRWGAQIDFSQMPTITLTGQNLLGKLLMELRTILARA